MFNLPLSTDARVVGRVLRATRAPLPSASESEDGLRIRGEWVGEDGAFSLAHLEPGVYTLCVSRTSRDGTPSRYSTAVVKVADGETASVTLPMP